MKKKIVERRSPIGGVGPGARLVYEQPCLCIIYYAITERFLKPLYLCVGNYDDL